VVTGSVVRDAHGRVLHEYAPFVVSSIGTQPAAVPANTARSSPSYDAFGRVYARTAVDGTVTTISRTIPWIERSCDARYNADAPQHRTGSCTEVERDGLGRVRFQRTFLGSSATPESVQETVYDLGGHVAKTILTGKDGTNTSRDVTTDITYDIFGYRREVTEPNSGT